jgi:type IV pilus assembly protein PilC
MLFSSRLPLASLIELCRVLRHYLGAGLTLVDSFRQQARNGPLPVRALAGRVAERLEHGDSLHDALAPEKAAFPPLFLSLSRVGEESGTLPEVFTELEKYYLLQRKLWREFWSQAAWPLFQFGTAVFVIALLIFILGILAEMHPSSHYDPLGWGLLGVSGALKFLGIVFGGLTFLAVIYLVLTRVLQQKPGVDAFLLGLPAIGPCLRALALARFCLALRVTLMTAMPVARATSLSLRATGNAAFASRTGRVKQVLRGGNDLTLALTATGLLPEDFRSTLAVGEESGRLDDVLEHQAAQYQDEARRRLTALTKVGGWLVWLTVALLIIWCIIRLYSSYLSAISV